MKILEVSILLIPLTLLTLLSPDDIVRTLNVATLNEAAAQRQHGMRWRYTVKIVSSDDSHEGYTIYEVEAEGGMTATIWIKGEAKYEEEATLTVQATMKVIRHKASQGFDGFVEYRLMDILED